MDVIFVVIVRKTAIFDELFTPIFVHEVEIILAHGLIFLKIRCVEVLLRSLELMGQRSDITSKQEYTQ
jgi:hypothetical protein